MITGKQLIAWINGLLESNYASFENLSSGEAYCKLLCKLAPGSLPLAKVRRSAKSENGRVFNYKLLQHGMDKACLRRAFRIEDLISGRFRNHYELIKWLRQLFDGTHADRDIGATGSHPQRRLRKMAKRGARHPGMRLRWSSSRTRHDVRVPSRMTK
ncbi:microtubule-associated protein RP/EB family member 1-like [Haemaphysalis longicornis]